MIAPCATRPYFSSEFVGQGELAFSSTPSADRAGELALVYSRWGAAGLQLAALSLMLRPFAYAIASIYNGTLPCRHTYARSAVTARCGRSTVPVHNVVATALCITRECW